MVGRFLTSAAVVLALSACSSRPREFVATPASQPADSVKFAADHESCRIFVAQGVRSGFGARLASGGAGVAAGVGVTAAAVGGAASSSALGAAAAASAATVMLPVFGIAAAWGVAKAQKAKKERDVRKAMQACLFEQGHEVAGWEVAPKRKK
ncbi:MAG TPA: hypothetical protein VEZ48_06505 [Sphingomonadaceae bacterium]|nr:hypothetical protein [Sphingomonadaceae bacterium]